MPFAPLGVKLRDVHKTGLGSSAAMVTSLVSALFLLWTTPSPSFASSTMVAVSSPPRSKGLELVPQQPDKATLALCHNLAQYVHSLAQGKIGSGFDVSAAIWGSHIYRRFSVECLGSLLDESTQSVRLRAVFRSCEATLTFDSLRIPTCSRSFLPFIMTNGQSRPLRLACRL